MQVQRLYEQRIAVCCQCDRHHPALNICGECGCLLALKARVPRLGCPLGKWAQAPAIANDEVRDAISPLASHPEELLNR